ncbi:MAG: hypothetical protein IJZ93_01620 [Clostridia bacterium]|nr:hypothetical protein [Clostridia bacterium]
MEIVKYILYCIIGCFDALVGKGMGGGIKEGIIGLASLLFVILLFFISLSILNKKTKLNFKINILCSAGITILLVCLIFLMLIVFEKIF